jgi:hypothetical protein
MTSADDLGDRRPVQLLADPATVASNTSCSAGPVGRSTPASWAAPSACWFQNSVWDVDPRVHAARSYLLIRPRAPRGALLYPRLSREELGGRFLGPMADLEPKG